MGQCLSIWTDPIPLLSREARPQCSKLFRAKREPVTEVTEEPQVITTTGLWQPQVGTICASSRAQESIFLCSLWQEPFPALWSRAGCKVQSRAESSSSSWCSPCQEVSRAQRCAVGSKRAFTPPLGEPRGLQQWTWQHHRPRNRNGLELPKTFMHSPKRQTKHCQETNSEEGSSIPKVSLNPGAYPTLPYVAP